MLIGLPYPVVFLFFLVQQDSGEWSGAGGGGGRRPAALADHQWKRAAPSSGTQVKWEESSPGEPLPQHKLKLDTEKKRKRCTSVPLLSDLHV